MAIAAIAAAAGVGLQVVGAIREGQAKRAAADHNAKVANQNAVLAKAKGREDARRSRIQTRKALGKMRAQFGASGASLSGSAQDLLEESAANGELNALGIEHSGLVQAANFRAEANLQGFKGRFARDAGFVSASAILLRSGGGGGGGGSGGSGAGGGK